MPPVFYIHYFHPSNPDYHLFYQHYVGHNILNGKGNLQFYAKCDFNVLPSGVFKHIRAADGTNYLEEIR